MTRSLASSRYLPNARRCAAERGDATRAHDWSSPRLAAQLLAAIATAFAAFP
jgi:hypothetical protein